RAATRYRGEQTQTVTEDRAQVPNHPGEAGEETREEAFDLTGKRYVQGLAHLSTCRFDLLVNTIERIRPRCVERRERLIYINRREQGHAHRTAVASGQC